MTAFQSQLCPRVGRLPVPVGILDSGRETAAPARPVPCSDDRTVSAVSTPIRAIGGGEWREARRPNEPRIFALFPLLAIELA